MTEIEPPLMTILVNRVFAPPEHRNEQAAVKAIEELKQPLKVLDAHLHNREELLDKEFTIADLNVASVLGLSMIAKLDLSATPTAHKWLKKCQGSPARQKAPGMNE